MAPQVHTPQRSAPWLSGRAISYEELQQYRRFPGLSQHEGSHNIWELSSYSVSLGLCSRKHSAAYSPATQISVNFYHHSLGNTEIMQSFGGKLFCMFMAW